MKLLFCIKRMNGAVGGAERVLAQITAGLADRGHDVTLVTFDPPAGTSFYPLHARVRIGSSNALFGQSAG